MASITLDLANGRQSTFEVDVGLTGPAFFLLSVRKCGSTIFNDIGRALAVANRCRFISVADQFFFENINVPEYQRDPALVSLLHPGNAYGGFRDMPLTFLGSKLFQLSPKLLFVRDPRDALVSEFFSLAYSHPIPPSHSEGDDVTRLMERQRAAALQDGLDAFAIRRAGAMAGTMLQYAAIARLPSTTVLKYEDFIFDKGRLISTIAQQFGWSVDDELIHLILEWADIRPEREDPSAFIRQVTPGDHRKKLRDETIARLSDILHPAMELFAYIA